MKKWNLFFQRNFQTLAQTLKPCFKNIWIYVGLYPYLTKWTYLLLKGNNNFTDEMERIGEKWKINQENEKMGVNHWCNIVILLFLCPLQAPTDFFVC